MPSTTPVSRSSWTRSSIASGQVKESSIRMDERRFTEPVEAIEGTIEEATPAGVKLREYSGRIFRFSSVGTSAADMSAAILGENNQGFPSSATTKTSRTRGRDRPPPRPTPHPGGSSGASLLLIAAARTLLSSSAATKTWRMRGRKAGYLTRTRQNRRARLSLRSLFVTPSTWRSGFLYPYRPRGMPNPHRVLILTQQNHRFQPSKWGRSIGKQRQSTKR
jgi:hypothetical protein